MKRDWELIRRILVTLEERPTTDGGVGSYIFPELNQEVVSYHFKLLKEAGLIEAVCREGMGKAECVARNLTWAGHEFLDKIRSEKAWNRIVTVIKENGLEITFDAVKAAAGGIIAKLLGG